MIQFPHYKFNFLLSLTKEIKGQQDTVQLETKPTCSQYYCTSFTGCKHYPRRL